MPDEKDIRENKVMAAISYVFILFLVPLLGAKESEFAQFHAKQGMVLALIWVAVSVFSMIPIIGWVFGWILHLIMLAASIVGFIMAIQGKWFKMPVVYDLSTKIKF